MKRNRKAAVSFALAVLMFVMVLPITALAANPSPTNWSYNAGTDYITIQFHGLPSAATPTDTFLGYSVSLTCSDYSYSQYYGNRYQSGNNVTFNGLRSNTLYNVTITAHFSGGSDTTNTGNARTSGSGDYNYGYDKTVISKPTPYTSGNAVFIVAGESNRLNGVSLNGYALSHGSQYTYEYYDYNRTRVTIYSNALTNLNNGYHSVVFSFSDGYASTNFQVSRSSGSTITIPSTTLTANYTVTASSLRVREWGSTSARQVGSLARGTQVTVLEVSNGWGRVTLYNGKTGWVSMQYLRQVGSAGSGIIVTEPVGSTGTYGTYYTTVALRMRSGPSTSYGILGVLPAGTAVNVTRFDGEWGVCTINGQTVYVHTNYLRK